MYIYSVNQMIKKVPASYSATETHQLSNSVQNKVNDFLANSVVTSGIVISSILFACDQLLGMEQLSIRTGAHFIYIKDCSRIVSDVTFADFSRSFVK